jgi:hypothetical protein
MENELSQESFDANAVPETAEQAEQLLNHWQSEGEPEAATQSNEEKPQAEPNHELNYKGKIESHPLSKIIEFAQQGRDYAEKMGAFKKDRSKFDAERTGWQSQYEKQKKVVDEYLAWKKQAESNPGWIDHVRQSYQQGLQEQAARTPNDPLVQKLASTVEELAGKFSSIEEEKQAAEREKEDQALDLEISEYRAKFPNLPWGDVDENGYDLEKRILNHAIKIKTQSFRAAANDLLFDEHIKLAKVGGKEEVGKSIQKATKLGLGPPTAAPQLKPKRIENVRSKSWDEVGAEALKAMGID